MSELGLPDLVIEISDNAPVEERLAFAETQAAYLFQQYALKGKRNKGIWKVARDVYFPMLGEVMGWKNENAAYYHARNYYQSGKWMQSLAIEAPAEDYLPLQRAENPPIIGEIPAMDYRNFAFGLGKEINLPFMRLGAAMSSNLNTLLDEADARVEAGVAPPANAGLNAFLLSEMPNFGSPAQPSREDELAEEIALLESELASANATVQFLSKKNATLERSQIIKTQELNRVRGIQRQLTREFAQYPEDLVTSIYEHMKQPDIAAIVGNCIAAPMFEHPGNKPSVKPDHSEDVIALLSDLHFSEVTRRDDTCGFFPYNSRVAAERLWEILEGYKQVIRIHREVYKIDKINLAILGDLISGSIHKELVLTNDMSDQAAMIFTVTLIKRFIMELLQLGIPMHLIFTCGNHPRTTERMPNKAQAVSNQDWVIYEMLKANLVDSEAYLSGQLTWEQTISPYVFVDIKGWRHCFAHGTEVSFANDPSVYAKGIGDFLKRLRGLFDSPYFRAATGNQGATFDRFVCGNTHTAISGTLYKVNGCLTGQNELGTNWALEPIPACQTIWGVSSKRRETWSYLIDATEIEEPQVATNPMSEFAINFTRTYGRSPYKYN